LKALRYIVLSCMFLVYVSQPVIAMPFNNMSEMICCTEAEKNSGQDMPCCDDYTTNMENCEMDSCHCSIATSISAFTTVFSKEIKLFTAHAVHGFPLPSSNKQTPLFPVWTPPDIA